MKILMLAPAAGAPGPVGHHTTHLVTGLERLGCEVTRLPWGRTQGSAGVARRVLSRLLDLYHARELVQTGSYDMLVVKTAHDWSTLARDLALTFACRRHIPAIALQPHGSQPERL